MSIVKGNIVRGRNSGRSAIVLAVRKDGTAAKLYEYGPDREVWVPVGKFTIEVSGLEQCYKCLGSGLYYMGGAVVNGVYTGKTGECYACRGKGEQTDEDRLRCHYYWHRKVEEGEEIERPMEATPQQPIEGYTPKATPEDVREWREAVEPPAKIKIRMPKKRRDPRSVVLQEANELDKLRDKGERIAHDECPNCGTGHRYDVPCL